MLSVQDGCPPRAERIDRYGVLMPMTALLDGTALSALEIADDQWRSVCETYRELALTMTCGERAIRKVSSRGLKCFAHHPKSGCDLQECRRRSKTGQFRR